MPYLQKKKNRSLWTDNAKQKYKDVKPPSENWLAVGVTCDKPRGGSCSVCHWQYKLRSWLLPEDCCKHREIHSLGRTRRRMSKGHQKPIWRSLFWNLQRCFSSCDWLRGHSLIRKPYFRPRHFLTPFHQLCGLRILHWWRMVIWENQTAFKTSTLTL